MSKLKIGEKLNNYLVSHTDYYAEILRYNDVPEDVKFNYIEVEPEMTKLLVSFLANNRYDPIVDPFTSPQRQTAKPTTVFKKLFPQVDLPELNKWIDKLKLYFVPPDLKVVEYDKADLWDMYDAENYITANDGSTLGQSCMRHEHCRSYIDFYKHVPVSGVALHDANEKIHARALLWECVDYDTRRGVKLLDRVYSTSDVVAGILEQWGKDNADFIKVHTISGFRNTTTGEIEYKKLYVPVTEYNGKYPYVDTFSFKLGSRLYTLNTRTATGSALHGTEGSPLRSNKLEGYIYGHVPCGDQWVTKDKVTLIGKEYISNDRVVNCAVCNLITDKLGSSAWKLQDNDRVYTCGLHPRPTVITINEETYKVCLRHKWLYSDTCPPCAGETKTCKTCFGIYVGSVCKTCDELVSCSNCTVVYRRGECVRGCDSTQNFCVNCTNTRCRHCAVHITERQQYCNMCTTSLICRDCGVFSVEAYCELCRENAFYCSYCDDWSNIDNRSSIEDLCTTCFTDYYIQCEECNTDVHIDDYFWIDGDDTRVCSSCYDNSCHECLHMECECGEIEEEEDVI
jgi:hypothetical protein